MSKEAFQEALAAAPFIALASSVDDQPNVRLIDTYYDADKNMLLFPTSRKTPKVAEFAKNEKVAFTTLPNPSGAIIRVQKAHVKETDISLDEIKDALIAKRGGFEHLLGMLSQDPVVYQICFDEALLTVHGQKEVITL